MDAEGNELGEDEIARNVARLAAIRRHRLFITSRRFVLLQAVPVPTMSYVHLS